MNVQSLAEAVLVAHAAYNAIPGGASDSMLDAACVVHSAAVARLAATPAVTLAEIIAKAAAAETCMQGDELPDESGIASSLLRDILGLATQ